MNLNFAVKTPPQPSPQGGGGSSHVEASSCFPKLFEIWSMTKPRMKHQKWTEGQPENEVAPSPSWGGLGRGLVLNDDLRSGFAENSNFGGHHVR